MQVDMERNKGVIEKETPLQSKVLVGNWSTEQKEKTLPVRFSSGDMHNSWVQSSCSPASQGKIARAI